MQVTSQLTSSVAALKTGFSRIFEDEWINAIEKLPLVERLMIEWQANEFAGLLLVPRKILEKEFQKLLVETEKLVNVAHKDRPAFLVDLTIISLASKFQVSEDVARIRLERDGLK